MAAGTLMSDEEKRERVEKFFLTLMTKLRPDVEFIVERNLSGKIEVHHNKGEYARAFINREA